MAWNLEPVPPTPTEVNQDIDGLDPVSSTPAEINHKHLSPQTSSCWGRLFQILTAPFFCCKKTPESELHSLENDNAEWPQDKIYNGQTNGHTSRAPKTKGMKLRNGRNDRIERPQDTIYNGQTNGHTSRAPKTKGMKLRNGRVVKLDPNTHQKKPSIVFTRGDLYTKDSES